MPVRPSTSLPQAGDSLAGLSATLHRGPVLEVALLSAGLLEELHPLLRQLAAHDPRPRWQRAAAAGALLRAAGTDPCRAMVLAARERAVDGDVHVRADGADPDTAALRHALRVSCVLRAATAAGRAPAPPDAQRYVGEQRSSAVLLGAEPDDLPSCLEEVEADVERVRLDATGARPAGALSAVGSPGRRVPAGRRVPLPALGDAPGPWRRAGELAGALLPGWARELFAPAPDELDGPQLREALGALPSLEAAAGFRPRP
ncbi:oxygenase MpaB family protein [Kineococcus arenarius]|uniref:oxygenase MpaB family protein n=1 Tax=unclassified Kineococcus TaxID=2621656 RepID=UPI003D7C7BA8